MSITDNSGAGKLYTFYYKRLTKKNYEKNN